MSRSMTCARAGKPAGAAAHGFVGVAHRQAAADGAMRGEHERFCVLAAFEQADNLRDHVARALQFHMSPMRMSLRAISSSLCSVA